MEGAQKKVETDNGEEGRVATMDAGGWGGEGNAQVRLEWKSLRRIPIVRFELILWACAALRESEREREKEREREEGRKRRAMKESEKEGESRELNIFAGHNGAFLAWISLSWQHNHPSWRPACGAFCSPGGGWRQVVLHKL